MDTQNLAFDPRPSAFGSSLACLLLVTVTGFASAQTTPAPVGPGSVTISLAEYNQLLDRIRLLPAAAGDAPVPAVISRAEIALRVNGELARATITIEGDVLRTGPTKVPLVTGGTVLDARLNGQTVPLLPTDGGYSAVLPGRGRFALTVTWAAPITSEPGRASVMLPLVRAGSVRATIDAPGEGSDLKVEPAVITRRTASAGRIVVEATLTPSTGTRVTWSSREAASPAQARATRLLSDARTMVTMGEGDVRVTTLFDVTIVQGTASSLDVRIPPGFEVASVSGSTIEVMSERDGVIALTVAEPERRRHQFLVALERGIGDAATRREIALPWIEGSQRESGEVAVEGVGALELKVDERAPLTRIDVGEVGASIQSLAREPLLAAYRYQRRAPEPVSLSLEAVRFPDAAVLTAIAERAVATTLVTAEGRALTEVTLTVRNQAQPFLKVGLPQGAVLLSAEVDGVSVKPAQGADGARVPLLRAGLQPRAPYTVSFVYLHAGSAFAKKGDAQMTLARVDMPVTWLEWELFLPDRFDVSRFDGQAFAQALMAPTLVSEHEGRGIRGLFSAHKRPVPPPPPPPPGGLTETVTIQGSDRKERDQFRQQNEPSVNVQNLQRRAAGILPVRIDVPRAGRSHVFVRPIVIDEDTTVAFRYRAR
jgi:hypothetical protein